jgi:uncharacterized protein (DUF488 family)
LIQKLFTIGVYRKLKKEFFKQLAENDIDTFVDIRRRRAVRGSLYSFVNSSKLQDELAKLNIKYVHLLSLAPTEEIRNVQRNVDSSKRILQRKREELSEEFKDAYQNQILKKFNIEEFINVLDESSKNVVLFCVESNANACHRSIVAKYLKGFYKRLQVVNL